MATKRNGAGVGELPQPERSRLIRVIHTAKRSLQLGDDDYRALLEGETGKRSSAEMSAGELMRVVERMRRMGFKPTGKPGKKLSPKTRDKPGIKDQRDKIRALWIECHRVGVVEDPYEGALNSWVKRMTGVDRVDWLVRADHCNRCIEALKKMLERGTNAD